jgi:hypothetical protein
VDVLRSDAALLRARRRTVERPHGPLVDVAGEFDIADGDTVTVDTRPFRKSALLSDGTNVTRALASRQFAPVPAGENVPVEVLTYGPSKSTLTLKPKFFRGY